VTAVSESTWSSTEPVLRVEGLVKHFPVRRGIVIKRQVGTIQAVDGVSFSVRPGETLGLVGESGVASPRSPGPCCASSSRPVATPSSRARTSSR
jgi:ABC-type microcin C transport system duplicated ATPase subunit YejF